MKQLVCLCQIFGKVINIEYSVLECRKRIAQNFYLEAILISKTVISNLILNVIISKKDTVNQTQCWELLSSQHWVRFIVSFFEIKFETTVFEIQISRTSFSRFEKSIFKINGFYRPNRVSFYINDHINKGQKKTN